MQARREVTVRGNYALFWSEWPSNWERSPFVIDLRVYNCVEQWMMAEKARFFGDTETEALIMESTDPRNQQKLGRQVRGYDEERWNAARYGVVLRGTLEKYRQNKLLREKLLASGDLEFVEASPIDLIWGIGMRAGDPGADDPSKWRGLNLLGKAITEARTIIRAEQGK